MILAWLLREAAGTSGTRNRSNDAGSNGALKRAKPRRSRRKQPSVKTSLGGTGVTPSP